MIVTSKLGAESIFYLTSSSNVKKTYKMEFKKVNFSQSADDQTKADKRYVSDASSSSSDFYVETDRREKNSVK